MNRKTEFTWIGLAACLLALAAHAQEVSLDTPRGGWRYLAPENSGFMQEVNYPAVSVNSGGHSEQALIQGRIAGAKKKAEAQMVANGVAMPLAVGEGGKFARPYAFGVGSNGIEVRSPDGKSKKRVQFYEVNTGKPQARLRVVLSWDSDNSDLDLHVVSPDGEHVFYGNRVGKNGGALDVDVTTGFGPEIFASPSPPAGVYHVYVNYYGRGSDKQPLTMAQVAIVTQEGTVSEKRQVAQVPLRKPGELTLIKSFSYP